MDSYVYCFCAISLAEIQRAGGIENSRVRLIEHNGIIAVTTDYSGCAAPSLDNVISHHRVVNSISKVTTPIPCRFGTVMSRSNLEAYIEANSPGLKVLLDRVRGCVEMALRITWSSESIASEFEDEINARSARILPQYRGPGTRFLADKLRQAAFREIVERRAQDIKNWVDDRFAALVKDTAGRLIPEAALIADIAHLVERAHVDQYRELFRSAARERTDLRFSSSGPWAPYSFAVVEKGIHLPS